MVLTFSDYRKSKSTRTIAATLEHAIDERLSHLRGEIVKRPYIKQLEKQMGEKIFDDYIDYFGQLPTQMMGFEDLVANGLAHIFSVTSRINIPCADGHVEAYMSNPVIMRPGIVDDGQYQEITPAECLIRKLTYSAPIFVDITIKRYPIDGKPEEMVIPHKKLFDLPVMVRSRYCVAYDADPYKIKYDPFDMGGYFIIHGVEKAVIGQEKLLMNVPYVFKPTSKVKCEWFSELRSQLPNDTQAVIRVLMMPNMLFVAESVMFTKELPLVIVLRVLGVSFETFAKTITSYWTNSSSMNKHSVDLMLERNYEYTRAFEDVEAANNYVRSHLDTNTSFEDFMDQFMPHMGDHTHAREKGEILVTMVQETMLVHLGICKDTNRDDYRSKRIDSTGRLIGQIIRRNYSRLCSEIEKSYNGTVIQKKKAPTVSQVNIVDRIKDIITKSLNYALSTGNWNAPGSSESTTGIGVAQLLQRYSFQRNLHMMAVPTNKSGKQTKQRALRGDFYGMICPAETPEGAGCGLTKNQSLLSMVSIDYDDRVLHRYLNVLPLDTKQEVAVDHVFVNGRLWGVIAEGESIAQKLRQLRRKGKIPFFTSVVYEEQLRQLRVRTDSGRICRPLYVVDEKTGSVLMTEKHIKKARKTKQPFLYYLENGLIEIIDSAESHQIVNASDLFTLEEKKDQIKYTHCDIDPALIFGRSASNIPFPNHDQSSRNTFQAAMGKQASGIPSLAFKYRSDNVMNINMYPQKPLASNNFCDTLKFNEEPAGQNLMVLVNADARDQEDSIIMCSRFIEMGGGRIMYFHSYTKERKTMGIGKLKRAPYLDDDGIPEVGQWLNNGDIVIGEPELKHCVTVKCINPQKVEDVKLTTNPNGVLVTVTVSEMRVPIMGDKFSARHGQKGVISVVCPYEDMPFDPVTGEVPDIVINCQAFPSRMTIAMFAEAITGMIACEVGRCIDATPFRRFDPAMAENDLLKLRLARMGFDVDAYADQLDIPLNSKELPTFMKELGFLGCGDRILYDGIKGKPLRGKGFMCPIYYQRLKHMVLDKVQCRDHGKTQKLTRQPVEGRAAEGGLRFGKVLPQFGVKAKLVPDTGATFSNSGKVLMIYVVCF